MRFCDRLRTLRMDRDITQRDFAKKMGVAPATISQYEQGNRTPNFELLQKMADYFAVTVDYLLGVSDVPYTADASNSDGAVVGSPDKKIIRIPVLGDIPAGADRYINEEILGYVDKVVPQSFRADDYFALRADGHSMEPLIADGDIVILRYQPVCDNGSICAVRIGGESSTLKRVKIVDGGLYLVPENPAFPVRFFGSGEVQNLPLSIIGVVVESRKSFVGVGYDDF